MTSEFELIASFTADLPTNRHVTLGVGDDAAALRFDGEAVVTTDIIVENVHFKQVWSDARQVGRKAVAVNISDVEAMGATPVAVVVSLAFPEDTTHDWVREFAAGVREECDRVGAALVGGDLSRAALIVVNVTALGDLGSRQPITRSGARPGDVVAVKGRLGWAGAGLAALSRGFRSPQDVVRAALEPEVQYGQGIVAAQAGATAMIDVSDGLVQDLAHVARASAVAIDVDSSALEVTEAMARVGAATGKDPLAFALNGGEDFALAATFALDDVPEGWRVIGTVRAGEGITVDGEPYEGRGWDHLT